MDVRFRFPGEPADDGDDIAFFADVETNLLPVVKEMLFRDAVGGNLRI